MRQRPLRIAGARQAQTFRVRAPHRGALLSAKTFPIISTACSRCMALFVEIESKFLSVPVRLRSKPAPDHAAQEIVA
jgi:hypothetical protein